MKHEFKPAEKWACHMGKTAARTCPRFMFTPPRHVLASCPHNMSPLHVPTTCSLVCVDLKDISETSGWKTIRHLWRAFSKISFSNFLHYFYEGRSAYNHTGIFPLQQIYHLNYQLLVVTNPTVACKYSRKTEANKSQNSVFVRRLILW